MVVSFCHPISLVQWGGTGAYPSAKLPELHVGLGLICDQGIRSSPWPFQVEATNLSLEKVKFLLASDSNVKYYVYLCGVCLEVLRENEIAF